MSFESVDIFVRDTTPSQSPVEGVLVRVFGGSTFFSSAVTDANGRAGFTLTDGSYTLRFYKFQVSIVQPQAIEVLENPIPPATPLYSNDFNIDAEVFTPPEATDPRLCRCSGYFRDVTGAPRRNLDIHFIGKFCPTIIEGAGVMGERRSIRTDANGFAQVDLIRGAFYDVILETMEESTRQIAIPDLPSSNLPSVILPIVSEVVLDPTGPYTLAVGAELELTPEVYASSGLLLDGPSTTDVIWRSSDPDVLSVGFTQTTIVLRGIASGTAELTAERLDQSIVSIPNTPIEGQPITVNVT